VYRARQISLDRDVAVKTLRTPLATQAGLRFLSEAKTLSRIASARVIHVYAYGDFNGQPYIAMEYGEGTNLAQMIAEQKFHDIKSRLEIALQIAEGLEQIHLANIAHRDVKPSNVLVDPKGNVKLIDFGIAWREDSRMTEIGQALGTPAYMPPEQILRYLGGSATDVEQYKRVDIYSFGILLYELFTGELPFKGETRCEVEREIVHTPVTLEPLRECHVPEGVVELIRLATSKNPAARPRSFGEVVNVLRIYIAEPQTKPAGRPAPARSFQARVAALGILAAAVAAAGVYQLRYAGTTRATGSTPALRPAPQAQLKAPLETQPPVSVPASSSIPPPLPVSTEVAARTPARRQTVQDLPELKRPADPVIPMAQPPVPETVVSKIDRLPDALTATDVVEARRAAARVEYESIKNSNSPEALQNFAEKYPEDPFAPSASSVANQLRARVAASVEIRETLKRYVAAMHGMKLADVLSVQELDKKQQSKLQDLFHSSRTIEMSLVPTAQPQFAEPLVTDPAGAREIPSHAVVECDLDMLAVSGSGDVQPEKKPVAVHLKRTAKGWVITSL
jgi:hypothetical protein